MPSSNPNSGKRLDVPSGLHWKSRFFAATQPAWQMLSNLETRVLADEIRDISVSAPIYVTSLARSGTTIVTELLARHPAVTSHRYGDFPALWTPYWRNWLADRSHRPPARLVERAHLDRININNDSPEAVEELIWTRFFPGLHNPDSSNLLDGSRRNPGFDTFYRSHIRKLLAVREASRYLAKGNYNVARLGYLHNLFPDARFLIPIRHPVNHIASLVKQHRLFCQAHQLDKRVGRQLALAGHWEFGPYRRPVNLGDDSATRAVTAAWSEGDEVLGWAHLWVSSFDYIFKLINELKSISEATYIFKYEDLCSQSETIIDQLLEHTGLDPNQFAEARQEYSEKLSPPDYYQADFSDQELATIRSVCGTVATNFGYAL